MAEKKKKGRQVLLSQNKDEEHKASLPRRLFKAIKGKTKVKGTALSYEPSKKDRFMAGRRRTETKGQRYFGLSYKRKF